MNPGGTFGKGVEKHRTIKEISREEGASSYFLSGTFHGFGYGRNDEEVSYGMKKSFSASMVQAVDNSKSSAAHWPEAEAFCAPDASFDRG